MPKIPGRKSTRKTVKSTKGLLVVSFLMQHEEWLWRRKCVIEGCEHRMGPKTDEVGWATNWKPCAEQNPAYVARDEEGADIPAVGIACPCHVMEILEG